MKENNKLKDTLNYNSSSIDNQPTLLLKFIELLKYMKVIDKNVIDNKVKTIEIEKIDNYNFKFKLIFENNTIIETETITIPKTDAYDLLNLIEANKEIIVDINEAGNKIEIHLDNIFKNSLATKTALNKKQDKLSNVDLDNIAMINQYANDIKTNTDNINNLKTFKADKIDLNLKQEKLINQKNIKSINGNSLLGAGNLNVNLKPKHYMTIEGFTAGNFTYSLNKDLYGLYLVLVKASGMVQGTCMISSVGDGSYFVLPFVSDNDNICLLSCVYWQGGPQDCELEILSSLGDNSFNNYTLEFYEV